MQNAADALQLLGYFLLLGASGAGLYYYFPGRRRSPGAAAIAPVNPDRDRSIADWGALAERAEGYAPGHARRVAALARLLGEAVALPSETYEPLELAALLHDVGALGFAPELLQRPGPLDRDEQWQLQAHAALGARKALELTRRPDVAQWVRWHHERWDGLGYPDGLAGSAIPLPVRILRLADAADAMLHARPHRSALDLQATTDEINRLAGVAFDPVLARQFVDDVLPRYMAEGESPWSP